MTSQRPATVKTCPVPLYGGSVWLAKSIEDIQACVALLGGDPPPDKAAGLAYPCAYHKRSKVYLVGVYDGSISTLAHELAHTTFFILSDCGVPVEPGAHNEAFCYLLGHLMYRLHA